MARLTHFWCRGHGRRVGFVRISQGFNPKWESTGKFPGRRKRRLERRCCWGLSWKQRQQWGTQWRQGWSLSQRRCGGRARPCCRGRARGFRCHFVSEFLVSSLTWRLYFFLMGNFRFVVLFGSLNIPFKIGIPLLFLNDSAVTQFSFKKINYGNLKNSPKWPLIF